MNGSNLPEQKDIWTRFFKIWNRLTPKQKEALDCVYMNHERISKAAAAKKFGISINSLISRLRVAIRRFKAEFQEFEGMSPKRLPRKALHRSIALNGLWRYQSATWKATLYGVDPVTGLKREIEWRKIPKSKNLEWKTVARIKAEIIEHCPVPYFHDTEYFDGMKPTIISIGRQPEKTQQNGNDSAEPDLEAGFRDLD